MFTIINVIIIIIIIIIGKLHAECDRGYKTTTASSLWCFSNPSDADIQRCKIVLHATGYDCYNRSFWYYPAADVLNACQKSSQTTILWGSSGNVAIL